MIGRFREECAARVHVHRPRSLRLPGARGISDDRGEMDDRVHALESRSSERLVPHVADEDVEVVPVPERVERRPVADGQHVENPHARAGREQPRHERRTHVTGASGHEDAPRHAAFRDVMTLR